MHAEKTTAKVLKSSVLVLLTFQTSIIVLCLRYSRFCSDSKESPMYFPSSLMITAEMLKFVLVTILVAVVHAKCSLAKAVEVFMETVWWQPQETFQIAFPAFLYTIQNYLVIYALTYLDAATYQTTYQVRILTTAFFSALLLGKKICSTQWIALVLLMFGVVIIQLRPEKAEFVELSSYVQSAKFWAVGAVFGAAVISGYAGVYSEKLLKDASQPSLLLRSFQLGMFSLVFALLVPLTSDLHEMRTKGFLYGFTPLTWILAFLQATGGLLVAASMKYADNIIKNFATSASMVISTACSHFIFHDLSLESSFVMGTAAVVLSTFLYSWRKQPSHVLPIVPPSPTHFATSKN